MPAGNAVQIILNVPSGADELLVLRRDDGELPASFDDPLALPIYRGDPLRTVMDWQVVPAGVALRYRVFWRVGASWSDGGSRTVLADPWFVDRSVEPVLVLRDRLDLGLRPYVARGELRPATGAIPVLIASPLIEESMFPLVTVHVESEFSELVPLGAELLPEDGAEAFEGHLTRVRMKAVGHSLNVDERLALRRAMTAILTVNRFVFEEAGMSEIDIQFEDMDDFMTYRAPVYQAIGTVSCVASRVYAKPGTLISAVSVPRP